MTILHISANPLDLVRLNTDVELREISLAIHSSQGRDRVRLVPCPAARIEDIIHHLTTTRPRIVHFSVHRMHNGLALMGRHDLFSCVSAETLTQMLAQYRETVQLVVLAAVQTAEIAETIAQEVGCAIGMKGDITDERAVCFAARFYYFLSSGFSVHAAFRGAVNLADAIKDAKLEDDFVMFCKEGIDPTTMHLFADNLLGIAMNPHVPGKATFMPSKREVPERREVFVSYSHKDEEWLTRLRIHLKPLEHLGVLKLWADNSIKPGDDWRSAIDAAIARAKVAVLLVSPDFLASDFINDVELPRILQRARRDGATIFWIPLRPSLYERSHIANYQAAHNPMAPLSKLSAGDQDAALVAIAAKLSESLAEDLPAGA